MTSYVTYFQVSKDSHQLVYKLESILVLTLLTYFRTDKKKAL